MADVIGFIGLGSMGGPMALNLLSAGYSLRVYNRSREKTAAAKEKGATVVDRPVDVASSGGIVISMLSDDAALEDVAGEDLARALGAGGVHVSMGTISPAAAKWAAALFEKFGAAFVSAPVFGRPDVAAAKKLWIAAAGPKAARERVRPLLDAIGQGVFDFGDTPGAANLVKLMGNFMLMAAVEVMAEASALGERNGVPRDQLLGMFTKTLFNCPIYNIYSQMIIAAEYDQVRFALPLALKDMRLARETATASTVAMPVLSVLVDRFLAAAATGYDGLDASSLALKTGDDAGLNWFGERQRG